MITIQHVFYLVGALFAAWALLSAFDRTNPNTGYRYLDPPRRMRPGGLSRKDEQAKKVTAGAR